ncbi:hypothetical protein DICVIV_08241 [Dictyocaulus viviparus]|uniref:Uncharacterized protein n=1 Tax=Dictyocaulus viviparus TaxID=29172 RepID=A0A0D8XPQ1_DICVI|nr:hypothetical protein DICVIV_08241 [Dictyocaulus viviparus]
MNSILMQLCEVLIATMLLGDTSYTCEIIMLESKVHRYNKNYENSFVWSAYKLIAEYEKWRRQPNSGGMISNTAQSLAETAETMSCHGTLFLEAACHIWAKLERFKAISEVLISCPQLLGRIIRLLKVLEFEHEVEVFVAEVCDKQDTTLSPCDPVWVDWCKPRVQHPEKYGKRAEVILRCVKVLFQFLDYGSNRGYGEAWILLYTAIKHIEPTQIVALWAERYDWWPQFHTVHLPLEAGSRRAELLAALQRLPTE